MTCISWNCRGLAAATTNRELYDIVTGHKPAIVFLMETRAHKNRVARVKRRFRFQHYFCVEPQGLSGGLCLLWNACPLFELYSLCLKREKVGMCV